MNDVPINTVQTLGDKARRVMASSVALLPGQPPEIVVTGEQPPAAMQILQRALIEVRIDAYQGDQRCDVILDVTDCPTLSAQTLSLILDHLRAVRPSGRLALVGTSPIARRMLWLTRLDQMLIQCASRDEARQALTGRS